MYSRLYNLHSIVYYSMLYHSYSIVNYNMSQPSSGRAASASGCGPVVRSVGCDVHTGPEKGNRKRGSKPYLFSNHII